MPSLFISNRIRQHLYCTLASFPFKLYYCQLRARAELPPPGPRKKKKKTIISLISDTLLIEQLIYLTDFWNWAVEKRLPSSRPRVASV